MQCHLLQSLTWGPECICAKVLGTKPETAVYSNCQTHGRLRTGLDWLGPPICEPGPDIRYNWITDCQKLSGSHKVAMLGKNIHSLTVSFHYHYHNQTRTFRVNSRIVKEHYILNVSQNIKFRRVNQLTFINYCYTKLTNILKTQRMNAICFKVLLFGLCVGSKYVFVE